MNKLPALFDANGSFGSSSAERPAFPGPKDLLAHLDRLGVERALVWNTEARQGNCPEANRRLLSQIGRSPVARRRLVPAFTISPTMVYEHGAVEGLRKAVNAAGVAALRLPTAVTGAHSLRQTEPILDALSSRRPVVLVNNNDADGPDLLALAQRLPSVCFILTDVMWPRYVFVFDLMRRCPNVLVETSWLHTTGAIELIIKEFGADGMMIYAIDPAGGHIRVWEPESERPLGALESNDGFGVSLTFSPDNRRLVTGMDRGTVLVWDLGASMKIDR